MQSQRALLPCLRTITFFLVATFFSGSAKAEKVIYGFTGSADGYSPEAPLILDKAGNLYGTTALGGANNFGTVFTLNRTGTNWTKTTLYSFTGGSDGANPYAGLVVDGAGNLYGTVDSEGEFGCGAVFELARSADGWTELTLYAFKGQSGFDDGCNPHSGLVIDSTGDLFGATGTGGVYNSGTVFELTPSLGGWSETQLWAFNGTDGANPLGGVVFDNVGNIYGTTYSGGLFGGGTVFRLTPLTGGGWAESTIFSFTGGNNGCQPYAGVVFDTTGSLYGTTQRCGADVVGTVFKLTPTVGQWKMSMIHTFTGGSDGAYPWAGVIFDKGGNLWGTTFYGGLFGNGTVFRLSPPSGNGKWTETEYSFMGADDGAWPLAGVVFGNSTVGTLAFGTTTSGGPNNEGVVFQISAK